VPINFAAKAAITAGLMIVQVGLGAMRKIEGPRLESRKVSLSEYNTPLPTFWGRVKIEGCPMPWAEDLREKKKKSKTKGGKYAEYKYFGTWMSAIAAHEISAVRKIWVDDRLVYQVAGVGPIAALISSAIDPAAQDADVKLDANNLTIYLGTETQLPDPRMEAWYEDHPDFGPNSCPAHRGIPYLMFKDVPLEKLGNRIPTVSCEALTSKTPDYPYEFRTTAQSVDSLQFAPDGTRFIMSGGGNLEMWDAPTRAHLGTVAYTGSQGVAMLPGGGFYCVTGFAFQTVDLVGPSGGQVIAVPSANIPTILAQAFYVAGNVYFTAALDSGVYMLSGSSVIEVYTTSFFVDWYFMDINGHAWAVGDNGGDLHFLDLATGAETIIASGSTGNPFVMCNADGNFFVWQADLVLIDPNTWTVLDTAASPSAGNGQLIFRNIRPGASSIWFSYSEYSTLDLSLIRTVNPSSWVVTGSADGPVYDPVNHALIANPANNLLWRYLDRISGDGELLQTIVEDVASQCGFTIDAVALNQVVPGYSVGPGPAKDIIAPLLDIHHSILRPNDFSIRGIKRSTTAVDTIDASEFARERDEKPYRTGEDTDSNLPLELTVSFSDNTKDFQENNVIATRSSVSVDSERVQQINMATYCDTADDMQQKADRFLRWMWNSRWRVENALTAQRIAAEPGDLYDLDLDGEIWTCELQKITLSATTPRIACEWRRTFPSLVNLGSQAGSGMTGSDDDVIFVPDPGEGFVLDIPLVDDGDNSANPLLYYGAGGYGVASFPGATIYEGNPGGIDYEDWQSVSSTNKAIWGNATTALADANANLWDRGNVLSVRVFGGTLSSATEAEIDADPTLNMFALSVTINGVKHWELGNFCDATLTGSTSNYREYDISILKRGRRGTEWATGSHAAGDQFVLVSSLDPASMGLSDVTTTLYFKAQTFGRDPDAATVISFPYEGQSLMPYAPAQLKWTTDGTDLFGEIIRRTRVGGAWADNDVVPLSEASEAYEVDVLDGSGNVVRTITVTGTNTFTYLGADLAADGFSLSALPDVNVYQMSDAVGRGFALAA
jgi:Ni/Co efflux regulator RcnB